MPQRPHPPSLGVSGGGNSVQDRGGPRLNTRGMDDRGDDHVAVPRKRMRRSSTGIRFYSTPVGEFGKLKKFA